MQDREKKKRSVKQCELGLLFTEKIWENTKEKKILAFSTASNSFSRSAVRKIFAKLDLFKESLKGQIVY